MGFAPGGSSTPLSSATDVAFGNLTTNDFLKYDGSIAKWRNAAFDPASFGAEPAGLSTATKLSIASSAGINALDYIAGTANDTAALQAAMAACLANGVYDLVIPPRNPTDRSVAWVINDTLTCFGGLRIHAGSARIQQTVLAKPAFTIGSGVNGVEITVGYCEVPNSMYDGVITRAPYSAYLVNNDPKSSASRTRLQQSSGIFSLGSRGTFKGRFAGFRNAVRLAKDDASAIRSTGNNVDILVERVDFGLVYYGQEGLRADVRGSYVPSAYTNDPPHLIYALTAPNDNSTSKSCIIRGSAWDSLGFPFALKGQDGTVCEVLQATNCGGIVIVTDPRGPITFGQIHGIQLTGLGYTDYSNRYDADPTNDEDFAADGITKNTKDVFVEAIRGDQSASNDSNGNPYVGSKTVGLARISLVSTTNLRTLRTMSLDDDWTIGSIDIEYDTTVVSSDEALVHVYGDRSQIDSVKIRNLTSGGGIIGLRYASGSRGHTLISSPSIRRVTTGVYISPLTDKVNTDNSHTIKAAVSDSTFVINPETISTISSSYAPVIYDPTASSVTILDGARGERQYGGGKWYSHPMAPSLINVVLVQNTLYAMPMVIQRSRTISKIAINVNVAGNSSSAMRFGVYSDNGSGMPGAILYDIGIPGSGNPDIRFDVTSTGVSELTLLQPLSLAPGTYWIAYVLQNGANAEIRGVAGTSIDLPAATSSAALSGGIPYMSGISVGTLPNTFTSSGSSTVGMVRISYLVA